MAVIRQIPTRRRHLTSLSLNVLCVMLILCGLMPMKTTTAFHLPPSQHSLLSASIRSENLANDWAFNSKETSGDIDVEIEQDDGDDMITPYGNQTLAWTKRYRRLVPYESARLTAMRLGLRSKEEWDDIREFGKAFHGAHLVSRPDELYRKEWISWEEFLGVMRPYEEAKQMVKEELKLNSMEEYIAFVKEDTKRAESLRIPAKPEIYYRDKGWTSEERFFS